MKKKAPEEDKAFPISKTKSINGNRSLVREKVLQILAAYFVSRVDANILFEHIFYRNYDIDDIFPKKNATEPPNDNPDEDLHLLNDEELADQLADAAINWRTTDIDFGSTLLHHAIQNYGLIADTIQNLSENWEFERISIIDRTIIIIGATEMLAFPDIPIRVSINEAIELSKKYSAEKSKFFVNGLLDNIKNIFEKEKIIHKSELGMK